MMRLHIACCPIIAAAVLLTSPLLATTIHVPGDAPTIQLAINIAGPGDEVLVAPGTYYEHLVFQPNVQDLIVRSEAGASQTIIDAQHASRVITFDHSIGPVTIEGFTITNGRYYDYGGGIAAFASYVILRRNIIKENQQDLYGGAGGGVYIDIQCSWQTLIEDNLIVDNIGSNGAGIYTFAPIMIVGNTIVGNESSHTLSTGGGIRSWGATIENNIIANNRADDGGGVHCEPVTTLHCNNIWSNLEDNTFGDCVHEPSNISLDPLFCDPANGDYTLSSSSPCLPQNSPPGCGLIGAFDEGCGPVPVERTSWGRIKSTYH